MKHLLMTALLAVSLFLPPAAVAEGIWQVKGHAFSNVHAWQKGTRVRVSGRVSGGPARAPFQAVIHVLGDEGKTHRVAVRMNSFTGQGETFEGGFTSKRRSQRWQVSQIEVVGPDPDEIRSLAARNRPAPRAGAAPPPPAAAQPRGGPAQCFPRAAEEAAGWSGVTFSSRRPVCITVTARPSGRLVLMRSVAPAEPAETRLPKGEYTAKIVGDGFVSSRDFSVLTDGVAVDLD
jgi:hypothetical protein